MNVLAPASFAEKEVMLDRALFQMEGPVAVRYPRGSEGAYIGTGGEDPAVILRWGSDITLVSYGTAQAGYVFGPCRISQKGVGGVGAWQNSVLM